MPSSNIPSHIIELIHSEREKFSPFYSDIYRALYNENHIFLADWKETNAIMKPLTGQEFWNAIFDLMSFILAEAGEI